MFEVLGFLNLSNISDQRRRCPNSAKLGSTVDENAPTGPTACESSILFVDKALEGVVCFRTNFVRMHHSFHIRLSCRRCHGAEVLPALALCAQTTTGNVALSLLAMKEKPCTDHVKLEKKKSRMSTELIVVRVTSAGPNFPQTSFLQHQYFVFLCLAVLVCGTSLAPRRANMYFTKVASRTTDPSVASLPVRRVQGSSILVMLATFSLSTIGALLQ